MSKVHFLVCMVVMIGFGQCSSELTAAMGRKGRHAGRTYVTWMQRGEMQEHKSGVSLL